MKAFKIIDLLLQGILTLIAIVFGIANESGKWSSFLYFGAVPWQFVSISIHYFFIPHTTFQQTRNFYGKLVLIILILGMLAFFSVLFDYTAKGLLYYYLLGLLIFSPLLGIFYFVICWKEYRLMVKRELLRFK